MPAGFLRSDAILQTTFEVETPSEQVRLVVARTEVCTAEATARAPTKSFATVPMSRYPSSIPVRSSRGTTSAIVSQTAREYCLYRLCRGRTKIASGQRRRASAELIAE